MSGWRFVCVVAAGFAVATTWVQADQRPDGTSLLVLAADTTADVKTEVNSDAKTEPKPGPKSDAKADAKAGTKTDAKADAKAKTKSQTVNERVAMWLKTCLQDWDTATHMSKEQWRTTCERVSKERGKFLNETPESLSLPGRR
jgi:hypothetical protein